MIFAPFVYFTFVLVKIKKVLILTWWVGLGDDRAKPLATRPYRLSYEELSVPPQSCVLVTEAYFEMFLNNPGFRSLMRLAHFVQ